MTITAVPAVDRPVVLTAHPLQRIGAYALAVLAKVDDGPEAIDGAGLERAMATVVADAVRAAVGRDTKAGQGFFLKSSLSLYPNSPMFHPSNGKRGDDEIADRVRAWLACPDEPRWPAGIRCVLCGRPAAGYFGKMDVPLAESDAYRNTTPRRHEGTALCRGCLCCFHALPYGVRLTGGPSLAVHSWDEAFLARVVARQLDRTVRIVEVGAAGQEPLHAREVLALRHLRGYEDPLRAGVELLVFSNNNRGPTFEGYALDQALAEWLRSTMRSRFRAGFRALLRAHRTRDLPGQVGLARNAFRAPERIPGAAARYLARIAVGPRRPDQRGWDEVAALAGICFDYAGKVMHMDKDDLEEIRATARRVVTALRGERDEQTGEYQHDLTGGRLKEFYSLFEKPARLRGRLQRLGVDWALRRPRHDDPEPLITTRGFALLFDPDYDNQAWFHRQMFLVAVVEELQASGWRPDAAATAEGEADDAPLDDLGDGTDPDEADRADDELAG